MGDKNCFSFSQKLAMQKKEGFSLPAMYLARGGVGFVCAAAKEVSFHSPREKLVQQRSLGLVVIIACQPIVR